MFELRRCESCGNPDVREVIRERGPVYYVDWRCVECGWVDWDDEGGI